MSNFAPAASGDTLSPPSSPLMSSVEIDVRAGSPATEPPLSEHSGDSDRSSDAGSMPSLVTVYGSDSDDGQSPVQSPQYYMEHEPEFYPLDIWTDRNRVSPPTQPAHIHIKIKYPTLLAEIVGRCLIRLEVVASEERCADGELVLNAIYLPTSLEAVRALPAAVWNTFWADVVNRGLHALLSEAQRSLLRDIILVFRYYSIPTPEVTGTWGDFLHRLYLAAETGAAFVTPGEETLYDLILWAKMQIPDAFTGSSWASEATDSAEGTSTGIVEGAEEV